jgi:hypothetical protein
VAAQLDPQFLTQWVRSELEAAGEPALLEGLVRRAQAEGLDEDEGELDAAGQIAERKGWLDQLERAAGDLYLAEVREARGQSERLERGSGGSAVAWLRAAPGAVLRLQQMSEALAGDPEATVAELASHLGGSPGCSVR